MNIQARAELVEVVAQISKLAPYMRLGQLVCNLTSLAGRTEAGAVWDVEDEELLTAAREHLENLRRLSPEYLDEQIRAHLESDARAGAGPLTAS